MPRAAVDPAVGHDEPVVVEVELTPHEAVGELAGLDGERADVAGDLVLAPREDRLEDALARLVRGAPDERQQVGLDR